MTTQAGDWDLQVNDILDFMQLAIRKTSAATFPIPDIYVIVKAFRLLPLICNYMSGLPQTPPHPCPFCPSESGR